ncbi:MAG: universal stress protein [Bacteroidota bacterium]|nr:universal stress protein [Bacteroidota bacterium]
MIHSQTDQHILVPVDFTPESIHALRYAKILAQRMNMQITVMHVHQTLFDAETGSAFDEDMMANNRKHLDEILVEAGWDQIQVGGHVPIHTHFESGDIKTHLKVISAEAKYDLIVMSTKADDNVFKRLFGSVSTQVSQTLAKPVLIVPPNVSLTFPTKVVVGLTEEMMHSDAFEELLDMADINEFYLEFIFANNDDSDFQRVKNSLQDIIKSHSGKIGYAISPMSLNEDTLHEDLLDSAIQHKADMLVLVTRHRSFFENMGHRSITKRALHHPMLPVMIMHL